MATCQDCGVERPRLIGHHIIPKSRGGSDGPPNVIRICTNCHEDRHTGPNADSIPAELAQTPEANAKRAATMRRLWRDPDYRARASAARKASANRPEVKKRRGDSVRRWYAEPANRERVASIVRANNVKPERIEKIRQAHADGRLKPPPPGTSEQALYAQQFIQSRGAGHRSPESNAKRSEAMKRRWAEGVFESRRQDPSAMSDVIRQAWADGKYRKRTFLAHEGRCTCCGETEPMFLFAPKNGRQLCRNCTKATLYGKTCPHQVAAATASEGDMR